MARLKASGAAVVLSYALMLSLVILGIWSMYRGEWEHVFMYATLLLYGLSPSETAKER